MIEESYVSFDTAKLLREAGFDVPTRGIWRTTRTSDSGFVEHNCKQTTDDLCWNSSDGFQYEYLAPTQSLAVRWLREVHHYAVCAWYSAEYKKWFYAYGNLNNAMFDEEYNISDFIYDSYEQALESGLQEVIKLIKLNTISINIFFFILSLLCSV